MTFSNKSSRHPEVTVIKIEMMYRNLQLNIESQYLCLSQQLFQPFFSATRLPEGSIRGPVDICRNVFQSNFHMIILYPRGCTVPLESREASPQTNLRLLISFWKYKRPRYVKIWLTSADKLYEGKVDVMLNLFKFVYDHNWHFTSYHYIFGVTSGLLVGNEARYWCFNQNYTQGWPQVNHFT